MVQNLGQVSESVLRDMYMLRHYNDVACIDSDFMGRIEREGENTISFTNLNCRPWGDGFDFFRYIPKPMYDELRQRFIDGLLSRYYDLSRIKVLNFGFGYSLPGNRQQEYHFDYDFPTEQLWIPLCDYDDDNGTEYVHIEDEEYYRSKYAYFKRNFHGRGIYVLPELELERPYEIRRLHAKKHDLLRIPYYTFHRGRPNMKSTVKEAFYVSFTFEMDQDLKPANYKMFAYTNSDPY